MSVRSQKFKSVMSVIFIGILLFNYVNATMFWHSHVIDGRIVMHSHIYGKSHCTGNSDGGHTPGQLRFLDKICHTLCTDAVIPDIHVERVDELEFVVQESPLIRVYRCSPHRLTLRGPPQVDMIA